MSCGALGVSDSRKSLPNISLKKVKSAVEEYRDKLKARKAKVCTFGKNGPVGMQVTDALTADHARAVWLLQDQDPASL